MKKLLIGIISALLIMSLVGCASMSRQDKGVIIGGASGGVIGGVIGKQLGNTALGAIIGAAIGGAAGAYIGNYMDEQAEEIERDIEGAKIERVGEGIKITFDSGLLFDVEKSQLKSESSEEIEKLANILNKYEDTNILLEGHTDATGSEEFNMQLSKDRAESVSGLLLDQEVDPTRVSIMGYGETQPIGDNDTLEGRQLNRRVEIAIFANDKLKKIAESKTEG
jgi:outer membrane protein OmpA-like peptidoglycan-associated protein